MHIRSARSAAFVTIAVMASFAASGCASRQPTVTAASVQAQGQQIQDDIRNNPHMSDQQKAAALAQIQKTQSSAP